MKRDIPDYLKLFIRREGKVVLGKNYSNVWLLVAVLVATFLAIAFSNGSLNYLNDRMNDPFIKWVDIKKEAGQDDDFARLTRDLDSLNAVKYHYKGYSYDYEYSINFFGKSDSVHVYLKNRFFDFESNLELIRAILHKDNLIVGVSPEDVDGLDSHSVGVFLTQKSLSRLGYEEVPAYVDIYFKSEGAEDYGFKEVDGRVRVPVPVLGVVRRLPGSVDLVAFTNLYRQFTSYTFNMANEEYGSSLCFSISQDIDEREFVSNLQSFLEEETDVPFEIASGVDMREMYSWMNPVTERDELDNYPYHYLGFHEVMPTDTLTLPYSVCSNVAAKVAARYPKGVYRIFKYDFNRDRLGVGDYISVQFKDLKAIKPFAEELVNRNGLEVEMAQINAKENFQSVSVMAISLSVVMVIFAIVCILLFITNLLQSYFQKVKRNIGTFKAFGISNRELQKIYMTIMLALVAVSLVVSLVAVSLVELIMYVCGLVKAEGFGYLSLWHCSVIKAFPPLITVATIIVIVAAAAITVKLVMKHLLSATPGDLIYDR